MPNQIVTAGPYNYIRHPIYTANLMLLIGLLAASGSLWLVLNLVILIAYYVPTILVEETAIKQAFPEYRQYAARTGRFLPRLLATKKQIPSK